MRGRKPNPNRPLYASMIADARITKGWTQAQLGAKVGKDAATIKKYEGGTRIPPFDVLYDICQALEIDVYDAMDLDLRLDYSTGYHQFVDAPYLEILALLDDDIKVVPLKEMGGGTDDDIAIMYGDDEGYASKMKMIIAVAAIKRKLKQKYYEELSRLVTKMAKDIATRKIDTRASIDYIS